MPRPGSPLFTIPGLDSYFGGKGGQCAVRRIINAIPPHTVYIEPCLGSGRIMRHKQPAALGNYGIELDRRIARMWQGHTPAGYTVRTGSIFQDLPDLVTQLLRQSLDPSEIVVYVDPPYLLHTRRNPRPTYGHEFTVPDHHRLFTLLQGLSCRVMLSHLPCPEYAEAFAHWSTFTYTNATRRGPQLEQVWCNFQPSAALHEYTFIGDNKRQREQIRRHYGVILRRVAMLPPAARVALAAMVDQMQNPTSSTPCAPSFASHKPAPNHAPTTKPARGHGGV